MKVRQLKEVRKRLELMHKNQIDKTSKNISVHGHTYTKLTFMENFLLVIQP